MIDEASPNRLPASRRENNCAEAGRIIADDAGSAKSRVTSMAASRHVGIAAGGNGKWALVSKTNERSRANLEA
jgi:hypothetical protein